MQNQLSYLKISQLILIIVLAVVLVIVGVYLYLKMSGYYSNMKEVMSVIVQFSS